MKAVERSSEKTIHQLTGEYTSRFLDQKKCLTRNHAKAISAKHASIAKIRYLAREEEARTTKRNKELKKDAREATKKALAFTRLSKQSKDKAEKISN